MILLKTPQEIEALRKANRVVAEVREGLRPLVRAGVTTGELDRAAEELIRSRSAQPAFKGYRGFPKSICVSVNEEVVHGIPGERKLADGDVVGIDLGVIVDGFFGDTAFTLAIGKVPAEAARLIRVTEEALYKGIDAAREGNHLHDIGAAVQGHVEAHGFSVVRDFVGHGIGRALHEDPQVPNYGKPGTGPKIQAGLVLAIEPMINLGRPEVRILNDGWTAVTADGKISAHFEHSIAVTKDGPVILSQVN
jgi:methionyl aminopeptidase